jgi:hypothetical protein
MRYGNAFVTDNDMTKLIRVHALEQALLRIRPRSVV